MQKAALYTSGAIFVTGAIFHIVRVILRFEIVVGVQRDIEKAAIAGISGALRHPVSAKRQ